MGLTGRYNFPGMQKIAKAAINAALATTTWGAWILASPFKIILSPLADFLVNWLANHGLILLNIGANIIDGVIDQKALDKALNDGIQKVLQGRDKITPAQGKAIDDAVRKAFDEDADLDATPQ